MERELFTRRFLDAAATARDFARTLIEESLPDEMLFRIRLNSSYDGNPLHPDEVTFPNDSTFEEASRFSLCSAKQVVDALWRDGRVPEWVDVCVIGETGSATLLQLLSCGRFTSNPDLLYHAHEGWPPFHVTGPVLPARFGIGQETRELFSIYDRTECWTPDDVRRVTAHVHKVWSLDLVGNAFDDRALLALPILPRMEILELHESPIAGPGLVALAKQPKLRVLRIYLDQAHAFFVPALPPLGGVESLTIHDPPTSPWGSDVLLQAVSKCSWITFGARERLFLEGRCPDAVRHLSITAKQLAGSFRLARKVDLLCLQLSEAADADIERLLHGVEEVDGLDLSGTPVTAKYVDALLRRYRLRYLNVASTGVSETEVRRINAAHPGMKVLPNLRQR